MSIFSYNPVTASDFGFSSCSMNGHKHLSTHQHLSALLRNLGNAGNLIFARFGFCYPSFLGHLHLAYRLCLIDLIAFQARSNFSIPNQHISDTLPLDVQSKDSNQFFRLGQVLRNDSSPNSEFQSTFKHWTNRWTVTSVSFTFHSPVQVSTSANRLLSQAHL